MADYREIAKYEAKRLRPQQNQLDRTGRDQLDYEQLLWLKLHETSFSHRSGKTNNRIHWINRVARNAALSFGREIQRVPFHTELTPELSDPHDTMDSRCFLSQLYDSPVADDVEFLLGLVDHDYNIRDMWEKSETNITLRAFRDRVSRARTRVIAYVWRSR